MVTITSKATQITVKLWELAKLSSKKAEANIHAALDEVNASLDKELAKAKKEGKKSAKIN